MMGALAPIAEPAIAIDREGCVLETNAAAESLFDDDLRVCQRRIVTRDRAAGAALAHLIEELRTAPDAAAPRAAPIVVHRAGNPPVLVRSLPIPGAARSPFLGARALLLLAEARPKPPPDPRLIRELFGLTRAEARLASLIAGGSALDAAAGRLGVSRGTARTQLKSVFAKTETHRQGELAALLAPFA